MKLPSLFSRRTHPWCGLLRLALLWLLTLSLGLAQPLHAALLWQSQIVDSAGDVGEYSSLVLDSSGHPVISYFDNGNSHLKLVTCGNATCTSGNTIVTVDTRDVGEYSSLALDSSGHPVISYYDRSNGDLKLVTCDNATCSARNSIVTVDSAGDVGEYTSLALDSSGHPVISYYDASNGDLKLVTCGNATCTSGNSIVTVDSAGNVGTDTSLALDSSGHPVISYLDNSNLDLKLVTCGNATCTSGNTIVTLDSAGTVGFDTSLALDSSGHPVISYDDFSNFDLKLVTCGNATCTSGNSIVAVDSAAFVGEYSSLALDSSGHPVISYYDAGNADLKLVTCGNATCTSGNSIVTVDSTKFVGRTTSLALDSSGHPIISYYDFSNGDLKLAQQVDVPSVTVNQAAGQADPTSNNPVRFTANFSEAVTGFTPADVTLSGTANLSGATVTISGGPSNYTISVAGLAGNGTVSVALAANVVTNAAGNGNLASTSTDNTVTVNFDSTAPVAHPTQSPAANANGWTDSDVTVAWGWTDNTGGSGLDLTHCTLSSTSSGEGTLTLTATCQDKAGNVGTASYTVKVDKTPPVANPTLSPPANAAGWNNTNVTVNWNWTDSGSGIDAANCPTSSTSTIGVGTQTLTALCFDQVGNFTNASYTVKVDRAAPVIVANVNPSASSFGWYNSAVTISFTCQEQGTVSGLATNTVGGNFTFSSEGTYPAVTNTGSCTDIASNVATSVTVGPINIDLTKPTISAAATTGPNANGWYNSDVTVHFACADALSGIAFCPGDQGLSSEGAAVASTAQTARDKARNVSDLSNVVTVKLDKTAPVVTVTGVNNGATYTLGSVPTAACSTTDALSGVATQATLSITGGSSNGSGIFTATCSGASDVAGNSAAPTSVSYTVNALSNSSISQLSVSAVYNATPQPCAVTGGNLPIHTVTPTLRNVSTTTFTGLFFRVKSLEYTTAQGGQQPVLCNASSSVGGVGSTLTIANSNLPGGNSQFNPGEDLLPIFQVGLPVRAQYRFFVDLYAVGAAAATDDAAGDGEYLGSLAYTFEAGEAGATATLDQRLFLPLITAGTP